MSDSAQPTDGAADRRSPDACHLDLSATTHPVTTARQQAEAALTRWHAGTALTEDAVLVVCELVANAVLHAGGASRLTLVSLDDSTVRVEVSDGSRAAPAPRQPNRGRPGGHGLLVVRALCRSWGTASHPRGKTVWAELTATQPRRPAHDRPPRSGRNGELRNGEKRRGE